MLQQTSSCQPLYWKRQSLTKTQRPKTKVHKPAMEIGRELKRGREDMQRNLLECKFIAIGSGHPAPGTTGAGMFCELRRSAGTGGSPESETRD